MSSAPVREAFRAAWAVPNLPLIETINGPVDYLDTQVPVWATFGFTADETGFQTMGSSPWMEESGVAVVFLCSESGTSDTVVADAAEEVRKFWAMWISPDKNIWVNGIVGPRPPDPDAQGITYSLSVELHYRRQFKGA